ncbi:hypothetical protein [Kibdelosporangium philippinense]|nr:hypothetical protein [Kibdelosporangium philippinense]
MPRTAVSTPLIRDGSGTPGEGMRIGEAVGLRRQDMHLLADS